MTAKHAALFAIPLACALAVVPRPAGAAPPPTTTALTVAVTGQAEHVPDALVATLAVERQASNRAAAQVAVNQTMASVLAACHAIKGLRATTGGYNVFPVDAKQTSWQAQQSLILRFPASPDAVAARPALQLIGSFQAKGLVLNDISGTLSARAARQTRIAAIADAVAQMRAEAEATATALGDQVGAVIKADLTSQTPFRPMMLATRMATAAPQVQPGPMTEQVSLSATIQLRHPARGNVTAPTSAPSGPGSAP
ncbi:MAG: SIMPL domain-containing protein [Acidiphilium sp.]|nr:SIMPL domain-containing protein [Acidiphilium sp.]MDD4935385.1 SIMPL domain-containing protein [Acidiphilium sp.]